MCGIFGIVCSGESSLERREVSDVLNRLFLLSESRGKEASGVLVATDVSIRVVRDEKPASQLIRSGTYRDLLSRSFDDAQGPRRPTHEGTGRAVRRFAAVGHSRLVTNGSEQVDENNQPVISARSVGVHNGIVVNTQQILERYQDLQQKSELDSELIFSLLDRKLELSSDCAEAVRSTFEDLEGAASIAAAFTDQDGVLLATNTGSLYWAELEALGATVFASERSILERLLKRPVFSRLAVDILHLAPGSGALLGFQNGRADVFGLNGSPVTGTLPGCPPRTIVQARPPSSSTRARHPQPRPAPLATTRFSNLEAAYRHQAERFEHLVRCRTCILPETMPFIDFDEAGVCNYCRNHRPLEIRDTSELTETVQALSEDERPLRCLVGASGGRDSSYVLHYVKNELGLDPVAYTYDWGLVTDLARRNVSRLCGKLGIEHIIVSANISRKRDNVRRNVEAWLQRPRLGLIPLFMAGDKQYFYHAKRLKKQLGLELIILGENMLERTNFKTGFAGIEPALEDRRHVYTLPLASKLRLAAYYGREFVANPRFLNRSIADSVLAFGCYYLLDRSYVNLFHYVPWREDEIISLLTDEYGWETASDTTSTWRIGDGTSAFYNFAYLTIAGFTENDTFRSNQIREGLLSRDTALQLVAEENEPRIATIYDYLQTIGVRAEIEDVLERISSQPKMV